MVVQNYKNDVKERRETETILEVDGCKVIRKAVNSKLTWQCLTCFSIFCLFCLYTSLVYYVWNKNNEIQQLHEIVNTLASDVNNLKFQYLDDDRYMFQQKFSTDYSCKRHVTLTYRK